MKQVINICQMSDLKPGEVKYFKYGLHQGMLLCDDAGIRAFKSFCSHMGGPIRKLDACTLKCQWHGATFDSQTGKAHAGCQAPEGTGLPVIELHVDDGRIWCEYEPPKDPWEM